MARASVAAARAAFVVVDVVVVVVGCAASGSGHAPGRGGKVCPGLVGRQTCQTHPSSDLQNIYRQLLCGVHQRPSLH